MIVLNANEPVSRFTLLYEVDAVGLWGKCFVKGVSELHEHALFS